VSAIGQERTLVESLCWRGLSPAVRDMGQRSQRSRDGDDNMLLVQIPWGRKVGNNFSRGTRATLLSLLIALAVLEAEANNLKNWIRFN
jgi:hypothetical protein